MKNSIIIILIIINAVCYGQKDSVFAVRIISVTVGKSFPCPMDTIKGWVYYNGGDGTPDFAVEGYFINKCGGLASGPWWDCPAPAFIFKTAIRSDYIGSPHKFRNINYSGRFTDLNFKTIPKESVYGLLIPNKNETDTIIHSVLNVKGF